MELLVEKHIINQHHPYFDECRHLTFLSKNLYNATLYCVRQQFIHNHQYLTYHEINKKFTHRNQYDYRQLPSKVAKHTQQLVDKNMKSFFGLLKRKKNGQYDKKVNLPKYVDKNGLQVIHYEKRCFVF